MPRLLILGQRHLTTAQRDRLLARIDTLNTRAETARYARPYTGRATPYEHRLKAVARRLRRFLAGCEGDEWIERGRTILAAYESGDSTRKEAEEGLRWLGINVRPGDRIGDEDRRREAVAAKTSQQAYAERLRAAREEAGMTLKTVADHLGITRQAVHNWESGAALPTVAHMNQLAQLWGAGFFHLAAGHPRIKSGVVSVELRRAGDMETVRLIERWSEAGDALSRFAEKAHAYAINGQSIPASLIEEVGATAGAVLAALPQAGRAVA